MLVGHVSIRCLSSSVFPSRVFLSFLLSFRQVNERGSRRRRRELPLVRLLQTSGNTGFGGVITLGRESQSDLSLFFSSQGLSLFLRVEQEDDVVINVLYFFLSFSQASRVL